MQAQDLVLRDVHVPAAPSLWPPAPGWWLVAAILLLAAAGVWAVRRWRRRRLQAWLGLFDGACSGVRPSEQVAGVSELLRRAARRVDAGADRLQGEAWMRFLDGEKRKDFSEGAGRLLLEGGYRREVDAAEWETVRELARKRFVELMAKRK